MFIPNAGRIIIRPIEKQQELSGLIVPTKSDLKYGVVTSVSNSIESSEKGRVDFLLMDEFSRTPVTVSIEPGMTVAYAGNDYEINQDLKVIDSHQVVYIEIEDTIDEDDVDGDYEDYDNTDTQEI